MITFLAILGICGAAVGGYHLATKEKRVKALPMPKNMNKQPWVFPDENKDGTYTVSHILLYLMATEDDGVPEDWMTDVKRLEGDRIDAEKDGLHEGFWNTFFELNKEFRKFDKEIDKNDEMQYNSSSAGYQLYLNSLYEMKCEIYELAQECYEYMRANEEEYVEEEEVEEEVSVARTVEEEKLLAIYHSEDSTPEMKAEAEYLLEELKKMNPESYTNPKLQDMELDMETIRRIVNAKKV